MSKMFDMLAKFSNLAVQSMRNRFADLKHYRR